MTLKNWDSDEQLVLKARIQEIPFCKLEFSEKKILIKQIILKVACFCGCTLPSSEIHSSFLEEELIILLNSLRFKEITLTEILLAFRFNSLQKSMRGHNGDFIDHVKFYGGAFSINYFSQVLNSYLQYHNFINYKMNH